MYLHKPLLSCSKAENPAAEDSNKSLPVNKCFKVFGSSHNTVRILHGVPENIFAIHPAKSYPTWRHYCDARYDEWRKKDSAEKELLYNKDLEEAREDSNTQFVVDKLFMQNGCGPWLKYLVRCYDYTNTDDRSGQPIQHPSN